jgi:hypothetical protein
VVVETVVEGQLPVVEGSSRVDQQLLSWEEDFVEGGALGSDGADD